MFPWTFFWAPQYNITWNSRFFQDISRQRLMEILREPVMQDVVMRLQNNEEPTPQQLDEITYKLYNIPR